eukprot:EG_transcript_24204
MAPWDAVRRWGAALRRLSRSLRFSQPEVEAQFQEVDGRFTISVAYFWMALTALFLLVSFLVRCSKFGWFHRPDVTFYIYLIPFGLLAGAFAALRVPYLKAYNYHALCAASFLTIVWVALSVPLNVREDRQVIEATTLVEVFVALQHNEGARLVLHKYLAAELGRKYLWYALVINFCHLDLLQFLSLTRISIAVFASVPVSLWIVSFVSPLLGGQTLEVLVMSIIVLLYAMGLSLYMVLSRRRQFELSFQLQRTLQKEAEALKEVAQQE